MDIDDIFWKCDNVENVCELYVENSEEDRDIELDMRVECKKIKYDSNVIKVIESKGNGVFDNVGGGVWEASLLLSVYILQNLNKFQSSNVIELGCGVGLPSLLLTTVRSHLHESRGCVTLTDFETFILKRLVQSITDQFEFTTETNSSLPALNLRMLDWQLFSECEYKVLDDLLCKRGLCRESADILMGSALCYSSSHHICLADLIMYYLSGRCTQVVVCQLKDRPGFLQLVSLLLERGVPHSVQEVSPKTYSAAQQIAVHSQQSVVGEAAVDSTANEEVWVSSAYDFGNALSTACASVIVPAIEQHSLGTQPLGGCPSPMAAPTGGTRKNNLISTPRDAFVLLIAHK